MKKILIFLTAFVYLLSIVGCNNAIKENIDESDKNIIMKTELIRVLCIGHSFSNNSVEYVSQMVTSFGGNLEISSLYYQGCSPKKHLEFYNNNEAVYDLYTNGVKKEIGVTMESVLEGERYDYITFQGDSAYIDTLSVFEPLIDLAARVREHQPESVFMMHQTWSLCAERLSTSNNPITGGRYDPALKGRDYFELAEENFQLCAENLGGIEVVPVGEAIQVAKEQANFTDDYGSEYSIYTDLTSHLSIYGKYLSACVWAQFLYREIDVRNNDFIIPGISDEDAKILSEIAYKTVIS